MPITSRNYYKNVMHLENDIIKLFGSFLIGAAGAVASFQGGGIESVTKEATAGQYTIQLSDRFQRLLSAYFKNVHDSASGIAAIQVLEDGTTFQADIKSDGAITIQCLDFAGSAVNPASGEAILIDLSLRQSVIGRYDS